MIERLAADPVIATINTHLGPLLVGEPALATERCWDMMTRMASPYSPAGLAAYAISAIDLALWDLFGQATGLPVAQLLGGFTRQSIRTYNTCAGPDYIKKATGQQSGNFGLGESDLDDLTGFLTRADELALSLLDEGITAMKIWPFDTAAEATRGHYISTPDLKRALEPFEKIRRAAGDRMDVMVEFHGLWQLLPAMQIARALAPYETFWHEDPIRMDSLSSLRRYAGASTAPVCASETLAGLSGFRDLVETGVAGVVMLDVAWCGGLSTARKVGS